MGNDWEYGLLDTSDNPLSRDEILYFAERPSTEYDEVVLQADYCARATISFYRFRQLGGDHRLPRVSEGAVATAAENPTAAANATSRMKSKGKKQPAGKLKLDEPTGRGVHYISSHPQVRMLHLSVIALLILFESAANAYFFAQQSEFGLFGGIFQAAAVSLANVAVSYFIIGFWGLRHISMPIDWEHPFSRRNLIILLGLFAILVGLTLILLVNLSAAHYRNILDLAALGQGFPEGLPTQVIPHFLVSKETCDVILTSELGQTLGSAATNAMCRPFSLHSLDAMVLFALGLAISAVAAFEGRRADSPFPGFSDAARQLETARRDLQYALEDYYDTFEDVVKDAESILGAPLSRSEKVALRRHLDSRVVSFRELLTSDPDLLSDEFDVDSKIIDRVLPSRSSGA